MPTLSPLSELLGAFLLGAGVGVFLATLGLAVIWRIIDQRTKEPR